MNLCFKFMSGRLVDSSQLDRACERLVGELPALSPSSCWEISTSKQVTIRFEVVPDPRQASQEDSFPQGKAQITELERLTGFLAELSGTHQIAWSVGHQMESALATFLPGDSSEAWLNALLFEVQIANSLASMELDAEPSVQDLSPSGNEIDVPSEDAWTSLLNSEQSFTRFPEWDDCP